MCLSVQYSNSAGAFNVFICWGGIVMSEGMGLWLLSQDTCKFPIGIFSGLSASLQGSLPQVRACSSSSVHGSTVQDHTGRLNNIFQVASASFRDYIEDYGIGELRLQCCHMSSNHCKCNAKLQALMQGKVGPLGVGSQ